MIELKENEKVLDSALILIFLFYVTAWIITITADIFNSWARWLSWKETRKYLIQESVKL